MVTVLASLNTGLQRALAANPTVYLLGEDILDPYGGAFKVTRGLSSAYPGRVLATPISEAGIVGVATGMALRGLRPVVELMFGDFITLAADQIINHAAKFGMMYGDSDHDLVQVPLVIRTPMGGRRGYGPTHSQTLEKHFLGVPGLSVLAPCNLGEAGLLLEEAVLYQNNPTLFIENKLLYLLPVLDQVNSSEFTIQPHYGESGQTPHSLGYTLSIRGAPTAHLTLAAYGYMAELARQAALLLAYQAELFIDIVVFTQLSPFNLQPLLASVSQTGRLLTVEEGGLTLGWGAEVVAQTAALLGHQLLSARRLAAIDIPIPASGPLEAAALPGLQDIVETVKAMLIL